MRAVNYGGAKTDKTQNYRLAEEIRHKHYCEAMLLLTATPNQGEENHSRFKNLLLLLDDNMDFSGLDHLTLFSGHGQRFTDFVIRTPKKDVTDAQGHKVFRGRQTHRMPFKMYPDEGRFYNAVAEYIRDSYKMVERLADQTHRRAAGFLLTTFQKLNASSTAAIRAALTKRLARLRGELADLPEREGVEELFYDERYDSKHEEQDVLMDDRQIREDEIEKLQELLDFRVREDKKLTKLLEFVDQIANESRHGH